MNNEYHKITRSKSIKSQIHKITRTANHKNKRQEEDDEEEDEDASIMLLCLDSNASDNDSINMMGENLVQFSLRQMQIEANSGKSR